MIIDAHADISGFLVRQTALGHDRALDDKLLPDYRAGNLSGLVNAIYLSGDELAQPKQAALKQVAELKRQVSHSRDFSLIHNETELVTANQAGRIGLLLSLEGAEPLESLADLNLFYDEGVRFVGLTWNQANQYSGGCASQELGISPLGLELLDLMAEKNMVLDLSHLSDRATDQALEYYSGQVIASHSNARSYCDHRRNLTTEQLKKLANRGGVVGLNVCRPFVHPEASADHLTRQLLTLLDLCGEDHVGFGFDFCDRLFAGELGQLFDTLTGHEQVPQFFEFLPLPDRIKDKLANQNWRRIYRALD